MSKGQRLAAIDSAALSSEVAAARATLATAQAKLAADQAAGASSTQLVADSASITVAKAQAQAQVSSATADLAGATITAPFAGTVTSVGYAVGQQVGGSGSAGLLVPSLAINRTSGTTTVLVPNGGKQVRRTITTGLSSGG